jgi:hypothetical protein
VLSISSQRLPLALAVAEAAVKSEQGQVQIPLLSTALLAEQAATGGSSETYTLETRAASASASALAERVELHKLTQRQEGSHRLLQTLR